MIDSAAAAAVSTTGADFSVIVAFRSLVFGLVAWRGDTQLLVGDETVWVHLPSWATALGFALLALAEWLVLRWALRFLRRRFH